MKENLIGRKVITPSGHETTIIAFDTDVNKYFCHVNGAKCFIDGDDYKILPLPIKNYKPTIVERFADNGAHSHWELIETYTGEVLWIENDNKDTSEINDADILEANGVRYVREEKVLDMMRESVIAFGRFINRGQPDSIFVTQEQFNEYEKQ